MTEQELAEIEARHQPKPEECFWRGRGHGGEPPTYRHTHPERLHCYACTTDDWEAPWPCDAARLLAHVRGV